eukprot:2256333-Rhodomonas_salina.1
MEQFPFDCYAVVQQDKGKEGNGVSGARGLEGVFVGFARKTKAKMVYVLEKSMVYVSSSVYLDRDEFPIAEAMAQKKMQERLAAVKEGPRIDVKTSWNEGMTGIRVDEREEITPMTDAQKDRIRVMLESILLEDLWAEAADIDRVNRLPERAIGVDNLAGDEDEDMR